MRTLSPNPLCPRLTLRAAALALVAAPALSGCAIGYYAQAAAGEASLITSSRSVTDWIGDPDTPATLRARLELAQRIRSFASERLALPDNRSYRRYADLHRSSAVWNVFATPPYSLTLKTWCYPLFGCAGYRGYFDQKAAQEYARELDGQGLDTYVGPVPAFSTLGWLPDPLLSTFIDWPELELARLIFHELAHQVLYVRNDTRFNESFATAVERAGLARWVAERNDPALSAEYALYRTRHADFAALVAQTRRDLDALYKTLPPADDPGRAAAESTAGPAKQKIFADLLQRYERVRDEHWDGYRGYDAFFLSPWNNARIAAMAAYNDDVPAFDALLAREGGDMPRFFAAVRKLADLDPAARETEVHALLRAAGASPP
jgi:predicted aminopeptidase